MSPHLAAKRLSAYLDDELPDRELRRVEAHISGCTACQSRLHGLRLVVSELQKVPAVEAPPSLARGIEAEAAMRWGPRLPGARRLLGRRGLYLLQDMIQLSAVTAAAVAIIALLIAYGSTTGEPPARKTPEPPPGLDASVAPERVAAGGRIFVFRDGTWWQQDLLPVEDGAAASLPMLGAPEALARAPWLATLLRRGSVVLELDGARALVDFAARPPSAAP